MSLASIYRSIEKIGASYKKKIGEINEADFSLTPPIGGWSFSEVYSHIFDASILSLMALQRAINGEGKNEKTHFVVKIILLFGSLPPGKKYAVPSRLADRVKKISLAEAEQFIKDFETEIGKIYPQIKAANPKIKVKHPRLGFLNAKQWLRFIEIHLAHHLKQIHRIEKSFV